MFLNTEQNNPEYRRSGRNTALLLLVAAFLFSQSLTQAHVHADGELTAACVVCHHADNSPILLPLAAQPQFADGANYSAHAFADVALPSQQRLNYLSRAPPTIQ